MTHQAAIRQRAAERYCTGELTPALVTEFEEHYFDCPECALAVRLEAAFAANARAALAEIATGPCASGGPFRDRFRLKE